MRRFLSTENFGPQRCKFGMVGLPQEELRNRLGEIGSLLDQSWRSLWKAVNQTSPLMADPKYIALRQPFVWRTLRAVPFRQR